jgi:hypothetical protein
MTKPTRGLRLLSYKKYEVGLQPRKKFIDGEFFRLMLNLMAVNRMKTEIYETLHFTFDDSFYSA